MAGSIDARVSFLIQPKASGALLTDGRVCLAFGTILHVARAVTLALLRSLHKVIAVLAPITAVMDPAHLADQAVLLLTHGVVTLARLVIEFVVQGTVSAFAETSDRSYQLESILALVADRGTRH